MSSSSSSSSPPSNPLLGICMNSVVPPSQTDGMNQEEMMDSLDALIAQEASYSCEDYLRRPCGNSEDDSTLSSVSASTRSTPLLEDCKREESTSPSPSSNDPNLVDASCREKMAEWSYRVCDHFKVPRNIVAIAFSYLDRFVARCSCDRTAFKLTSMTALYMATKVFNGRQLSIATLAELSRGEFEVSHIAEMETIMLRTLDWKLNPPIAQDFIQYFLEFLPLHCPSKHLIAQRAMFFAELCVYDYDLILHDRGMLAVACICNAIDAVLGMEDPALAGDIQAHLLDTLQVQYPSCCTDRFEPSLLVQSTQRRLWYLFTCSAQSIQEKTPMSPRQRPQNKERSPPQSLSRRKQTAPAPRSPTSVHQVASVSPISVTGKGRY